MFIEHVIRLKSKNTLPILSKSVSIGRTIVTVSTTVKDRRSLMRMEIKS